MSVGGVGALDFPGTNINEGTSTVGVVLVIPRHGSAVAGGFCLNRSRRVM